MITEDYVSFEIAKLLKEEGFNAKCNYVWILDKANNPEDTDGVYKVSSPRFMEGESYVSNEDINKILEYSDEYYNKDAFLCPTLQMVMKWLREVHKLYVEVYIVKNYSNKTVEYCITIEDLNFPGSDDGFHIRPSQESYEESCEAAIKYCLENLIE